MQTQTYNSCLDSDFYNIKLRKHLNFLCLITAAHDCTLKAQFGPQNRIVPLALLGVTLSIEQEIAQALPGVTPNKQKYFETSECNFKSSNKTIVLFSIFFFPFLKKTDLFSSKYPLYLFTNTQLKVTLPQAIVQGYYHQ